MLLCEVMVQFSICRKHYDKKSAYEGAVQQDREKLFLSAAAADRPFIQAFMFRYICNLMSLQVWLTRASLCEMYTRICEENGPADPVLQGIVSQTWRVC
jgi:hypothetical protein